MIIQKIRKSKLLKVFIVQLIFVFLFDIFRPLSIYALTGGPSQPEVQSFEPVNTTQMVDMFSGDFVYNIPLLDIGGYPLNISYHSGITMDQEASWVGLGWNINPGVINRSMRGLPDDFKGDVITKQSNSKPNKTIGVNAGYQTEMYGNSVVSLTGGIYYNNYKGMGQTGSLGFGKGPIQLSASYDNHEGISFSPSLSYEKMLSTSENKTLTSNIKGSVGIGYNSRSGLSQLTMSAGITSKKNKIESNNFSLSGSGYSFANPSYTPSIAEGYYSYGMYFDVKTTGAFYGVDPGLSLGGFYTESGIESNKRSINAYGFMYDNEANETALRDINREKDAPLSKNTRYLPIPTSTYDVYSVSGQGTGGLYKPVSGNVSTLSDPQTISKGMPDGKLTIELGAGNLVKIGGSIVVTESKAESGMWKEGNLSLANLKPKQNEVDDMYESVYFKSAGEQTVMDEDYYTGIGQLLPVSLNLNSSHKLLSRWNTNQNISSPIIRANNEYKRERRNTLIAPMTASEAENFGLDRDIRSYNLGYPLYDINSDTLLLYTDSVYHSIHRINQGKEHHFSEISTYNPDGTRYVYGIPAYNRKQKEVTFTDATAAVGSSIVDVPSCINNNNPNFDNLGGDKYYSSTEIPEYAHSYLLTGVLSPDYVDISGDGPTLDDLGTYTKFNYTRLNKRFKWRTPYTKANFNEMLYSLDEDGKGNYVYGEKEIWYLHNIETKNYIAIFHLSKRHDGLEAYGEYDTTGTRDELMKLDSISLYSRTDYFINKENAAPIKRVHFEYYNDTIQQALCKGIKNTSVINGGKLTLKSIYFTYGNNSRGKYNQYEFKYNDFNPSYGENNYDRWGNYKNPDPSGLKNSDFPYVDQFAERDSVDKWMSAWQLTEIKFPSGGKITVEYESDDYAYVQDKPAMQMYKIAGCGANINYNSSSNNLSAAEYLFFKLPDKDNFSGFVWADSIIKKQIVAGIQQLYFNFKVKTVPTLAESRWEHIVGYCEIDYLNQHYAGRCVDDTTYGYIKIKNVNFKNRVVNPITVAAWQFARVNTPELVYSTPSFNTSSPSDMLYSLTSTEILGDIKNMILGIDDKLDYQDYYGKRFKTDYSWIRMNNPDKMKRGGGSRVKQVLMTDEWESMTTNDGTNSSYGQVYEYTMVENGQTISSGVASYEPMIGNDENPYRTPLLTYNEKVALGPDNEFYIENPLGESLFPSPSVGYRKVTVRNHTPVGKTISIKHLTGYTVNEFYTAYDFPVRILSTPITSNIPPSAAINNPLKFNLKKEASASQGYAIYLNDMHGKQKAESTYNETNDLITKTEYFYKVENEGASQKHLTNMVSVVNKEGLIEDDVLLGMDIDMVIDSRFKEERTSTVTVNMNLDGFILPFIPPIPVAIPAILGGFQKVTTKTKTATVCKVINQSGILDRVVVTQDGAKLSTKNELYDKETGSVLMTSVQNEYGDTIYNFNYPSHWAYDVGMGQAFKNHGAILSLTPNLNDSTFTYEIIGMHPFVPGDEIYFTKESISGNTEIVARKEKYWILDVDTTHKKVSIVDFNGINIYNKKNADGNLFNIHNGEAIVKIIRSGRRNMQASSIGQITTLNKSPLEDGNKLDSLIDNVLQASAVQYSDKWQTFGAKSIINTEICLKPSRGCFSRVVYTTKGQILVNLLNSLINNNGSLTSNSIIKKSEHHAFFDMYLGAQQYTGFYPNFSCMMLETKFKNDTLSILNSDTSSPCYCNKDTILSLISDSSDFWEKIISFGEIDTTYLSIPTNSLIAWLDDGSCRILTFKDSKICNVEISPLLTYESLPIQTFSCRSILPGDTINPYVSGVRGIWRPKKNYVYYNNNDSIFGRSVASAVNNNKNYNNTNTRYDGLIGDIKTFWKPDGNNHWVGASDVDNNLPPENEWLWQASSEIYSPIGFEVENTNVLGISSCAMQGYGDDLPLAVVQNSKIKDILYDGFEDYNLSKMARKCATHYHWPKEDSLIPKIVTDFAHTGISSLKIESDTIKRVIINLRDSIGPENPDFIKTYRLQSEDVVPVFRPDTGRTYILSYWVKGDAFNESYNYVSVNNSSFTQIGEIVNVEGWHKIDKSFKISSTNDTLTLYFQNAGASTVYIDDIRIFPEKANMKSYVYDPVSFRLMSQLDENNYATFYEYDDEGSLVRVKRETVRGIMTIKESRQGLFKQVVD